MDEREHVIFNMVNGILLRPYISGIVWSMSDASMAVLREGIGTYKAIRGDLKEMVPFFPLGFGRVNDARLAYGVRNEEKAYLSVFGIHSDTVEIPVSALGGPETAVQVLYPASADCDVTVEGGTLRVKLPAEVSARLLEIAFDR